MQSITNILINAFYIFMILFSTLILFISYDKKKIQDHDKYEDLYFRIGVSFAYFLIKTIAAAILIFSIYNLFN